MTTNMKDYCFSAFDFLGLSYTEVEKDLFQLKNTEGVETALITFEKELADRATYVTKDSTFIKTIAKSVTLKKSPLLSGSIVFSLDDTKQQLKNTFTKDHQFRFYKKTIIHHSLLLFWVKFTLKGFRDEEMIKIIRYDVEKETFSFFNHSTDELFQRLKDENKIFKLKELATINEQLLAFSKDTGHAFIEEKNEEAAILLEKETKRIHDYYDLLETEDAFGETSLNNESREERISQLKNERHHLITQQRMKYAFDFENLTIQPIETLYVNESVEYEKVDITNPFAKKTFLLKGDAPFLFREEQQRAKEARLTIISDGNALAEDKIGLCSTCQRTYEKSKIKFCVTCSDSICPDCSNRSAISHAVLCKKHVETCTSCNEFVSKEEMQICGSCGTKYCKWCLSGGFCTLCNDLY